MRHNPPMLISPTDRIAVIGLGYVGLPLAVAFGKNRPVIGFDIHEKRIASLKEGHDHNRETSREELQAASHLQYTSQPQDLAECKIFIVTVPTPINDAKQPDLQPIIRASETVARVMKPGSIVVYESTVFPGCVKDICVPVLERESGFGWNKEFYTGYSPERINPGDKSRGIADIMKITSGSTPEVADALDNLYASIITAGTHLAPSIEVAEAAKVIENAQRDLNIAFMNELAIIFHRLGIDTGAVLEAAQTKWNFLPFRPGLVGGHCIGVDPYYLTHCAQKSGYHPEVILAGRRINDGMGQYVCERVIRLMLKAKLTVAESRILLLGLTFKENCPDIRNTRVIDIIQALREYYVQVEVHDPWADPDEAREEYDIDLLTELPDSANYEAVILAVGHDQYQAMSPAAFRKLCKPGGIFYDVKGVFPADASDERL